ncbi:ribulose-phosphate 3-epimerase [Spiroplasma gladiatoris]|uniref:Ribulose-phosphate 3-epimerase n=1 Tax=Spiroplasma gladiatoris TaxID=2143 RepID=A0A4P7AIB5_9MOLU|nr:ribulose-phosphate 3-epimerase [Spiroplasma gladiatoris]QBQ08017.1 ribulose-phosphate 3-epimerase [Spiroplasma gladiatoris]
MKKTIVAPSILTADFLNLETQLKKFQKANIEWIHYDVMDYHFVPNLSFGPKILKDITNKFNFNMDLHLMVEIKNMSVEQYLKPFILENVKQITLHIEAINCEQVKEFIKVCQQNQIRASLALNPNTSIDSIKKYYSELDNILIMSVYPGFGGQKFIDNSLEKIKALKALKQKNNYKYNVQVDGGINQTTFMIAKNAGADILVAGSYLVDNLSDEELIKRVREIEN